MRLEELNKNAVKNFDKLYEIISSKDLDTLFSDPEVIKKGLGITDANIDELTNESYHYCKHSEWDKAIECIAYLILLDPTQYFNYLRLGSILLQQKKWDEAISTLEMAAFLNPSDPKSYLYIGSCLLEKNDREKAKEAFDLCIKHADSSESKDVKMLAIEAKKQC